MFRVQVCQETPSYYLVNILELQKMGQQRGETIGAFSARLNGQASLCNLNVECPDCQREVSYKDKILMYQTICGLKDKEAIQRVLQSAAQVEGGELSLTRVIKLCQALEIGKDSQQLVSNSSPQLCRISTYQKGKQQKSTNHNKDNKNSQNKFNCGHCGSKDHSSKLNDRREKCQAFQETCSACSFMVHFRNM